MDRSMTSSPNSRRQGSQPSAPSSLPPWEQRSVAQVPYMAPDSPPLTQTEQQAPPSLWATRQNGLHGRSKSYTGHPDQDDRHYQHGVKTPLTAPPTKTSPPPIPYEVDRIASGPRSAPHLPAFAKGPPSPPDSTRQSLSSTSKSASPGHSPHLGSKPTITAMPGTMSARERSRSRHRTPTSQDPGTQEQHEHVPIGKRFRSVLRDIFRRDPVDETKFERIEDRHWADE
ncbi:hypothetical protein M409DRAFT_56407 [Zasmidium cellare ATCC 36951]|uniref:Uncharacterized protein n=1 Tax=Zasmidium cellare ATCC 36951 TaxID=1080233 RepID=A0A6A6CCV4_ZASCE|nr:uncharacterized protein M409DRAFT_56407 [Zasmidium cellare ATCC 36951]KAF2164573.1 hypothetical protein M409DRAFT_56407 [Zasmidium cellare ATCC 36951]